MILLTNLFNGYYLGYKSISSTIKNNIYVIKYIIFKNIGINKNIIIIINNNIIFINK